MAQCRRWNLLPWAILGTTILIALSGLASEVQGPLVLVPPNEALEISSGGGAVETVTPGNSVEDSSMTSDYGYFPDDSEPVERGSETLAHGEDFISPLCAVATSGLGSVNLSFCSTRSYDYYYQGSLGPGAISAIVIAAVLGVSVLFSLIIITVKKLSAS